MSAVKLASRVSPHPFSIAFEFSGLSDACRTEEEISRAILKAAEARQIPLIPWLTHEAADLSVNPPAVGFLESDTALIDAMTEILAERVRTGFLADLRLEAEDCPAVFLDSCHPALTKRISTTVVRKLVNWNKTEADAVLPSFKRFLASRFWTIEFRGIGSEDSETLQPTVCLTAPEGPVWMTDTGSFCLPRLRLIALPSGGDDAYVLGIADPSAAAEKVRSFESGRPDTTRPQTEAVWEKSCRPLWLEKLRDCPIPIAVLAGIEDPDERAVRTIRAVTEAAMHMPFIDHREPTDEELNRIRTAEGLAACLICISDRSD